MLKSNFYLACVLILLGSTVASAQTKQSPPILTVGGEVVHPLKLTEADIARLPRQKVTAKDHDGKVAIFEGVALIEFLRMAGVEFGEKLRGKNLALFLVVDAADGYRAVFALPELDLAFIDQTIVLADIKDGKALPASNGPWQIIVPNEKRHARWVRQVVSLTVRRA